MTDAFWWDVAMPSINAIGMAGASLEWAWRYRAVRDPESRWRDRWMTWATTALAVVQGALQTTHLVDHGVLTAAWIAASTGGALLIAAAVVGMDAERKRRVTRA